METFDWKQEAFKKILEDEEDSYRYQNASKKVRKNILAAVENRLQMMTDAQLFDAYTSVIYGNGYDNGIADESYSRGFED